MHMATARQEPGSLAAPPLSVLREHVWLLGLVLLYALSGLTLAWSFDLLHWMSLSLYADKMLPRYAICAVILGFCYLVYVLAVVRPRRLFPYLFDDLRFRLFSLERWLSTLLVLGLLPVFMSVFTSVKIMIPLVRPFDWDATFAAWDLWLHGGRQPWEILQPLLGHPLVTHILNINYHLWFLVLYVIVCWQAIARSKPLLRMQFFLSMLLAWALLGSLAATFFASVGPCYFGRVTGLPDPYAPLMDYLHAANEIHPVWALGLQDMLWQGYQGGLLQQGQGISAMPSMHIGAVMLSLLLGWRVHRLLGLALALFAFLTFLGSIHLGWHYAVDGYAAAIGTLAIWHGVGWLLRRDPYFQAARAAPARRPEAEPALAR